MVLLSIFKKDMKGKTEVTEHESNPSPLCYLAGVPHVVLSTGGSDCLRAGDTCSSDDTCSPRLRTLRQCVAGDGSVKLGPGARNQCENAMTALLSTPLHGCQCKRGMKKEKNCLSIYWSLHQSVLHGELGIRTQNLMIVGLVRASTVWYWDY